MTRVRIVIVASGLLAFAAAGLAFPFYMATSRRPVDSSKPLPPQATFRGPYINTGSLMLDLITRLTRRNDPFC